jgi:FkbM family methyltransferase
MRRRLPAATADLVEVAASREIAGRTVHYRTRADGALSGDELILREVLERKVYRCPALHFDVEAGERWLDLGANIGAFALYCRERGATAVCYEPEPTCFALLIQNVPEFVCLNMAVTARNDAAITFYTSQHRANHARGTVHKVRGYAQVQVPNLWAGRLADDFDGIKMDIEGAEGPILDAELLPKSKKLVLEYHTSRDDRVEALARRLAFLRSRYARLKYPRELDRAVEQGLAHYKSWFDRLIFAHV